MKLNIRKSGLIVASASALVTMTQCDAGLFDQLFHKKKAQIEQRMPNKDCSFGYHATTWQPWDTCHLTEPCKTGCGSANDARSIPEYGSEPWQPSTVTPHLADEYRIPENHLERLPEREPQLDRDLRFPKTTTIRGPIRNGEAIDSQPSLIRPPASTTPRAVNPRPDSAIIDVPVAPKRLLLPNQNPSVPTPLNPTTPFEPQRSRSLPGIPPANDGANSGAVDSITLPLPTTTQIPGQLPSTQLPNGEPVQVPAADGSVRYQHPSQFGGQPLQPTSHSQQDNSGSWRVMPGYYQAQQPAGSRPQQQFVQQQAAQQYQQQQQATQQYLQQQRQQQQRLQQPQLFRPMQVLPPQNVRPMRLAPAQSRVEFLAPPRR